jgi:sulfur-oxidizing protein SoxZ
MAKPRVKVPDEVRKGEVFEVKALIPHTMESGQRKDKNGKRIPRDIINKFICKLNGKEVFSSDWYPAISANPYIEFWLKATDSGELELIWIDDNGTVTTYKQQLKVS